MCGCISSSEQANATAPVTQLNGRPTRALTRAPEWRTDRPLTVQDIARMRDEFWDTTVEGNPQTWAALRVVAETIVAGDIAQANALLEASNITTPSGTLRECYDERGRQYSVPDYCLSYPTNLFQDKEKLARKPRRGAPSKEVIPIKLRMAGQTKDVALEVALNRTVVSVKEEYLSKLPDDKAPEGGVRFFFWGRECNDDAPLDHCNVTANCIITVMGCSRR
mmetsp:Transcript_10785/g.34315  ORF Transcript_10785/g.34315 Transcript_10785/m.34315 type:complete len:222 (-) Transcript_10785:97-762(-)